MYSYEDRVRAVEFYIKLGKRVRATIVQLGYPTKNALKGWHPEYEKRLDLPVGFALRAPKYTQAQKEAAVGSNVIESEHRIVIGVNSAEAAAKSALGVSRFRSVPRRICAPEFTINLQANL